MPISTRIAALKVLGREEPWFSSPESDELCVQVELEDGRWFALAVATSDRVGRRLAAGRERFLADPRVVYVSSADQETVAEAVVALTVEMSGYWVRRYRIDGKAADAAVAPKVSRVELAPAAKGRGKAAAGCGVAEVFTTDKRQFSILIATPAWWDAAWKKHGLRFYFGPPVLFVDAIELKRLRAAADAIAARGEAELCLYDAPRTTLPAVLADFKARHA